jgi:predicted RNase H-like HicB family nuclease
MRVDEPGEHRLAAQVHDLGRSALQLQDLVRSADGQDLAVLHGDRACRRLGIVDGDDDPAALLFTGTVSLAPLRAPARVEGFTRTIRPGGALMGREFDVVVERDGEGFYIASVPTLPGCHTQARSLDELMERVKEAIQLCLEVQGDTSEELDFVGVQRVRLAS